jgi:hypothetical protein
MLLNMVTLETTSRVFRLSLSGRVGYVINIAALPVICVTLTLIYCTEPNQPAFVYWFFYLWSASAVATALMTANCPYAITVTSETLLLRSLFGTRTVRLIDIRGLILHPLVWYSRGYHSSWLNARRHLILRDRTRPVRLYDFAEMKEFTALIQAGNPQVIVKGPANWREAL